MRMSERIVFWGDQDDISELLAQVQVAALISRHEGFGLSLVEAMSAGLPVIASDTGGIAEVVVHGKTGLLVPPENEARLAEAIELLVVDPLRRKAMGNAGLARYRAKFSASRMIERTLRVYEAAMDSSCDRPAVDCCSACRFPQACEPQLAILGD
jgi:glycosyltransferase involved in cell wall biosynthesis